MSITQQYFTLKNLAIKEINLDLDSPESNFEYHTKELKTDSLSGTQVLVKTVYLSNDPTQRGWIQKGIDPKRLYVPPVKVGEYMRSLGLVKVLKTGSDVTNVKEGDYAVGVISWSDYSVIDQAQIFNKIENTQIPLTMYLDVLGMTGLTAYFGLKEVGQFKEGQTVVISAASGATGSMAVQLAKKVFKAGKVIAISGSLAKCEFVKSLGADVALNYRDEDFKKQLNETIGDDYVDCYFDLVGGEILDQMLTLIKGHGRVIACGAISGYNDWDKMKISNYAEIITNRLTVQGFIVGDFKPQYMEAISVIAPAIQNGTIKTDETTLTVVDSTKDFKQIPNIWHRLFTEEKGNGKLITKISE